MRKKIIGLVILGIVVIFQFGLLAKMIYSSFHTIKIAEENERIVHLKGQMYDPYDPFKGRYLHFRFEINQITIEDEDSNFVRILDDLTDDYLENIQVFCELTEYYDEDLEMNIHTIKDIYFDRPDEEVLYITGTLDYYNTYYKIAYLSFPFENYYMQEEYAVAVDNASTRDFYDRYPYMTLAVDHKGTSVQLGITVDNVPVEAFIEEHLLGIDESED